MFSFFRFFFSLLSRFVCVSTIITINNNTNHGINDDVDDKQQSKSIDTVIYQNLFKQILTTNLIYCALLTIKTNLSIIIKKLQIKRIKSIEWIIITNNDDNESKTNKTYKTTTSQEHWHRRQTAFVPTIPMVIPFICHPG